MPTVTQYYIEQKKSGGFVRRKLLGGDSWGDYITQKIQEAIGFPDRKLAETLAEGLQHHPELTEPLLVIAVEPTAEEIWKDIEVLSAEMKDQDEKIKELRGVSRWDRRYLDIDGVRCNIEEDLAKEIVAAMLKVAYDQKNAQIALKATLITSYQAAVAQH